MLLWRRNNACCVSFIFTFIFPGEIIVWCQCIAHHHSDAMTRLREDIIAQSNNLIKKIIEINSKSFTGRNLHTSQLLQKFFHRIFHKIFYNKPSENRSSSICTNILKVSGGKEYYIANSKCNIWITALKNIQHHQWKIKKPPGTPMSISVTHPTKSAQIT